MGYTLEMFDEASLAEMRETPHRIPLHRRDGSVAAYALVDQVDAERIGQHRWHLNPDGYVVRNVPREGGGQRRLGMQRAVMGLTWGDPMTVDHVNHDLLDNRRQNLRVCTIQENQQNQLSRGGSSQYRGVSFQKARTARPWQAYARADGKQHHLGFFDTEDEAAQVAAAHRAEHMPYAID